MTRPHTTNAFFTAATILLTIVALGRAGSAASAAQQGGRSAEAGTPATIPASVVASAEKIAADPQVLALIEEQKSDAAAKARWNQFLELVRIPSPPRQELLKAAEIH